MIGFRLRPRGLSPRSLEGDGFGWTCSEENDDKQSLRQIKDMIISELSKNVE